MISLEHFIFLSSAFLTCQGTCKAPVLENGRHVPNKVLFEVGEWLQYYCDDGYMTARRNLVEDVQCLSSGWSTVPQCSGITCPLRAKTDQLRLVHSNGIVAKFACNDGLILQGSEIIQCYYYGWDPPLPTCQASAARARCPPPPQPMNIQDIKLKSDYFNGDEENINCKPGFQLHGAQSVICKNGQWTSPPQCVRTQKCDDPPSILFGDVDLATIKPTYHSGSVVTYKCNNGFEMNGLNEIVCINGNWSLPPSCIGGGCTLSKQAMLKNGIRLEKATSKILEGESVEFNCIGDKVPSQSLRVTCKDGKIRYPECTNPGGCILSKETMLRNSIRLENAPAKIKEGESVEFNCIGDTVPSQSLRVTCRDGKIHYPECINPDPDSCRLSIDRIAQNNLELPKSASAGKAYSNGDRIPARCKTNYYPASPSLTVECLDGEMIYPKCTREKPCRINQEQLDENFLEFDPNFDSKVYYENGETIHFVCKAGYSTDDPDGLCIVEDIFYPVCNKI